MYLSKYSKIAYGQLKLMLTIGCFLLAVSCNKQEEYRSSAEDGPTKEEIKHIYSHYIKGHFSEFVSHIASIQGKPRFYKEQIINLYKQQAEQQAETFGKIDSVKVEQIQKAANNKYATVKLSLFYKEASPEEVILQMVYTENGWKIK